MGSYRHLSRDDRDGIAVLRAAGHSNAAIAGALRRSPSTISREVRRNALDTGRYSAPVADGAYMARRQRDAVLERDERLARFVRDRLTEGWSPQQISGWLRSGAEPGLRAVALPRPSPSEAPLAAHPAIAGHNQEQRFDPRAA